MCNIRKYLLLIVLLILITCCVFLISEDKVQARNIDYYSLSRYESRVQLKEQAVEELSDVTPCLNLRSSYMVLSLSQVQSMNGISIRKSDQWGFYGHSTIDHIYEENTIDGDGVVIDYATGLMWHQTGSSDYMSWNTAKGWISDLNNRGYAGHHDWRLPTIEEAASLLESRKSRDLYIDPVFGAEQWGIWSGDRRDSGGVWSVYFSLGNVRSRAKNRYVRPVRTLKQYPEDSQSGITDTST